jgi:hypothetical protein
MTSREEWRRETVPVGSRGKARALKNPDITIGKVRGGWRQKDRKVREINRET